MMAAINSYQNLIVWQKGMALAEACYRATAALPKEETYGLTSQIRRASVSVPANIAEGHGRDSTGSFIQHLRIAQGSLKEVETPLLICQRVGLANENHVAPVLADANEIGKMVRSLIRSLQDQTG